MDEFLLTTRDYTQNGPYDFVMLEHRQHDLGFVDINGRTRHPASEGADNFTERRVDQIKDYTDSLDKNLDEKIDRIKKNFFDNLDELNKQLDQFNEQNKERLNRRQPNSCNA